MALGYQRETTLTAPDVPSELGVLRDSEKVRIRSPFLDKISAILFGCAMRVLFLTLRLDVRVSGGANPYAASGDQRFIYTVWHDSAAIAAFGGRHVRTIALTSHHRDGSFVANVLWFAGVTTVRGSTAKRGTSALREIFRTAEGFDIVITPDGPRGPRRQMTPGAVYLASRTGRPIVPTAFSCSNAWSIKGIWTELRIPKPFSTVILLAGDPIGIPSDVDRDKLGEYVQQIQSEMNGLDATACSQLCT